MKQMTAGNEAEFVENLSKAYFLSRPGTGQLLPCLEAVEVASAEVLWQEGDENVFTAFILSGRFEERKATEFGDKPIVVGEYGAGSLIGESSLIDSLGCPFTAVCLENARLLTRSQRQFERLQQEQPQAALLVLKGAAMALSLRLRKSFDRLEAIF